MSEKKKKPKINRWNRLKKHRKFVNGDQMWFCACVFSTYVPTVLTLENSRNLKQELQSA